MPLKSSISRPGKINQKLGFCIFNIPVNILALWRMVPSFMLYFLLTFQAQTEMPEYLQLVKRDVQFHPNSLMTRTTHWWIALVVPPQHLPPKRPLRIEIVWRRTCWNLNRRPFLLILGRILVCNDTLKNYATSCHKDQYGRRSFNCSTSVLYIKSDCLNAEGSRFHKIGPFLKSDGSTPMYVTIY